MRKYEKLTAHQVNFYEEEGYLLLERAVPESIIQNIRNEIERFKEEARTMDESNERLDLEDSHSRSDPRVRRIKLPHTLSTVMKDLLYSDHILGPARDLIGPDLRLHTTKLNMKSANYGAAIEWHQDFAFYPHTNDDALAIGVVIDDIDSENGPLMVFPGSHKHPIQNHHSDGVFVGAMDLKTCGYDMKDAVELKGPAGSISIHHARTVHGSALNTSSSDRRLLFYEMMAVDAFPVMGAMTSFNTIEEYNEKILCGEPTLYPRLSNVPIRIPQPQPQKNKSIYEVQSGLKNRAFQQKQ